jgi:sarcosine oxidase subunit alpha
MRKRGELAELRIPTRTRGERVAIRVDGRKVTAHAGETLFAALTAAGIRVLRHAAPAGETGAPGRHAGNVDAPLRERPAGGSTPRRDAAPTGKAPALPEATKKTARGGFCGMGVCQECRVTVDGRPDQRACMTEVRDGMEVSTDAH